MKALSLRQPVAKFNFIFDFYLLKSCNFNFSNLLLLINNSVGFVITDLAATSMADGRCLIKLTNIIKAKFL